MNLIHSALVFMQTSGNETACPVSVPQSDCTTSETLTHVIKSIIVCIRYGGNLNTFARVESQTEESEPYPAKCYNFFARLGESFAVRNPYISK